MFFVGEITLDNVFEALEKKNIYTEEDLVVSTVFERVNKAIHLERSKLEALKIFAAYLKSDQWLPEKDKAKNMELFRKFTEFNYDYQKTSDYFGKPLDIIKNFILRKSENLDMLLGEDAIDLVLQGTDIDGVMAQFRANSGYSSD